MFSGVNFPFKIQRVTVKFGKNLLVMTNILSLRVLKIHSHALFLLRDQMIFPSLKQKKPLEMVLEQSKTQSMMNASFQELVLSKLPQVRHFINMLEKKFLVR